MDFWHLDLTDQHFQFFGRVEDAVVPVEFPIINILDPRVGDDLEAIPAGRRGDVNIGAVHPDPVLGGLDNGVRLRVDGSDAVAVLHHVPLVIAVGEAPDASVVAGGEDGFIPHDDGPYMFTVAGGTGSHFRGDIHEILVPIHPGAVGRLDGRFFPVGSGSFAVLQAMEVVFFEFNVHS